MGFGPSELLIILVIVLLIFGPSKLPALGDALGRTIKSFRRSAQGDDELEVGKRGELGAGKQQEPAAKVTDADVVHKDR